MTDMNVWWVHLAPQNILVQLYWHLAIKLYQYSFLFPASEDFAVPISTFPGTTRRYTSLTNKQWRSQALSARKPNKLPNQALLSAVSLGLCGKSHGPTYSSIIYLGSHTRRKRKQKKERKAIDSTRPPFVAFPSFVQSFVSKTSPKLVAHSQKIEDVVNSTVSVTATCRRH